MAVIVCVPADSEEVVNVATPPLKLTGAPRLLTPSLNYTLPVGAPPAELTVAVKVTAWPSKEGLSDELTEVTVLAVLVRLKVAVNPAPAVAVTL